MKTIDAAMVQRMFLAGAAMLDSQKEKINDLNVFPVPDGDTGTNMTLTILSAADEVRAIEEPDMEQLAKAISGGSLKGARGNSGVIFSQLCRGFSKEMQENNGKGLTVKTIAKAAQRAAETAYKAVMKPKEGTILTVAKGISEKAIEVAGETDDVTEAMRIIIKHAEYVLSKTPDMLPVLKEAGVVDSGGQGLVCVLHGFMEGLTGESADISIDGKAKVFTDASAFVDSSEITFGYCTEFIIKTDREFTEEDELAFKEYLGSMGDSVVCVALDGIVKVHVHTNHPGAVFEKGLTYGQLTKMKVDNMREEAENNTLVSNDDVANARDSEEKKKEEQLKASMKEVSFLAVVPGKGLASVFEDMGAGGIIEGGQTMNPSTKDILDAAEKVNAKNIFILPNNSNIILAASQAADLIEDKKLVVIPTKTIPQGISAVVSFDQTADVDTNKEAMTEAVGFVKSGQVTYAVRDTSIEGVEVKEGDYIAIDDTGLVASVDNIEEAVLTMVKGMTDSDSELITIYYGEDVSEEEAKLMEKKIGEEYPDFEIQLLNGGQPVYYYIISVE